MLKITDPLSLADNPVKMPELTYSIGLTELPMTIVVIFVRMDVDSNMIEIVVPEMSVVVCPTCKIEFSNTLHYPVTTSLANSTPVVAYLDLLVFFCF